MNKKMVVVIGIMVLAMVGWGAGEPAVLSGNNTVITNQTLELITKLSDAQSQQAKESAKLTPKMAEAQLWSSQVVTVMKGMVSSFNEGLTVTSDQVIKFSDTRLGKGIMFIAFWKIIGNDILNKVLGLFGLVGLFILYGTFIKCFFRGKIVSTIQDDGKKVEEYHESIFWRLWEESSDSAGAAFVLSVLFFIIASVSICGIVRGFLV